MPGRLDTKVLTLLIQYCGGWGYGRSSRALKDYLTQEFKELIAVTEQSDRGITGNFDVTIVNTNTLIHSKKQMGQGKCESMAERQAIVTKIKQALEAV